MLHILTSVADPDPGIRINSLDPDPYKNWAGTKLLKTENNFIFLTKFK